jgi:hypothetical protein
MSRNSQSFVTPKKLLTKPQNFIQSIAKIQIKNLLSIPSKTPKLFSSYRSPSVPPKNSLKRELIENDVPMFLVDYMDCPQIIQKSKPVKRKTQTQGIEKRSKIFTKRSELKSEEKFSGSYTPTPGIENSAYINTYSINSFYKPYLIKISPRAKIRLYSPIPLNDTRRKSKSLLSKRKKYHLNTNITTDKTQIEFKPKPVLVNNYTKTFTEKLKRAKEISEQAKLEVYSFKYN